MSDAVLLPLLSSVNNQARTGCLPSILKYTALFALVTGSTLSMGMLAQVIGAMDEDRVDSSVSVNDYAKIGYWGGRIFSPCLGAMACITRWSATRKNSSEYLTGLLGILTALGVVISPVINAKLGLEYMRKHHIDDFISSSDVMSAALLYGFLTEAIYAAGFMIIVVCCLSVLPDSFTAKIDNCFSSSV